MIVNMKRQNMVSIILTVALLVILASACQPTTTVRPGTKIPGTAMIKGTFLEGVVFDPNAELAAKNFASEAELADFIKQNSGGSDYYTRGMRGSVMTEAAMEKAASVTSVSGSAEASAAAPTVSSDYSKTNVQVENVDEADIIKTDGEYIYTISGNTIFIVKAYPGEDAEIVSTIKFKDSPSGIFIDNDHLAVFGNFYDLDFFKGMDFQPRQGMTFFNIYDISDKENPKLVREYKFEGSYFQARMTGDYVYFVTTTGISYDGPRPMPMMIDGTTVKAMPVSSIYYYPIHYQSVQFANIHAIDLADPEKDIKSKSIAVESSQNMYMSEDNIYITYTEYINEWELRNKIMIDLMIDKVTPADKAVIEKIKETDNDVLSQQEKEAKILQIIETYAQFMPESEQNDLNDRVDEELQKKLEEYEYMEFTIINEVSINKGDIEIAANGKVPGHIMNQFSMDEDTDGTFRIATTLSQRWSYISKGSRTESSNNVFALDGNLRILSSLKDLAEGEQIYSTRFIGERLYMVTFRQVDPFFVIDLSNPKDIKELGKLKIPGFSRYLHPYDDNTIIGIGRDASESGRTGGLKISLFDVSDVENPKEVAKFVTDERYAQSTAEYEHKAFLFSKEKDLLVIPAYSQTWKPWRDDVMPTIRSEEDYNGAMVFRITKDEIIMRGIIDHSMSKSDNYGSLVERSLFIDGLLYTKSPSLIRINKIEDLSKVKNVDLESNNSPYPVY